MYKLYIANKNYSSWSLRAWLLMRELSFPFEEEIFPFTENSWEEYKKRCPGGLVPWLKDGDKEVWDSFAIAEYLAESHARVWPEDTSARAWARSVAAEMHSGFPALRMQCPMSCGVRIALTEISAPLQKDISRINELWLEGLNRFGGPFLAGEKFTALDAFFAPVVFRIRTYDLPMEDKCSEYAEHLLSIGSMREWEEAALKETWREPEHESDMIKYGVLVEDLRIT
ncbi:MAG: glutathione S-transferase [SAR86 cluster bacterium]|uniref:Glutathione S-transferase n=1 Tax=SAR86 cluster bacterium TaxID=2030880 RepID=A0A2A5CC57_9GAMM|nr:glutathione S-transferase [Gammaproteobacteria bacterium AH-315-E17]PCJ41125.1 MAG: glutathione S-transferase [SAR86 cluster bacterium]